MKSYNITGTTVGIIPNDLTFEYNGEFYQKIPSLGGYFIAPSGKIYCERIKKNVGNYYHFTSFGVVHNVTDVLMEVYGTKFRVGYIPREQRKKKDYKLKDYKKDYINPINIWYEVSGTTSDYDNYFSYFGYSMERIVEEINSEILCDNCVVILDYETVKIDWSNGFITEDYLSFMVLLYFFRRSLSFNANFQAKSRLYEDEYAKFGYIIQTLFRENLSVEYDKIEDESDEVVEFKLNKSAHVLADHSLNEKINIDSDDSDYTHKLDYSVFKIIEDEDSCEQLVWDNLLVFKLLEDWHKCSKISRKMFNDGFRNIIKLSDNRWSIAQLFVSYCKYYYTLESGIKKLDLDLLKSIVNLIT